MDIAKVPFLLVVIGVTLLIEAISTKISIGDLLADMLKQKVIC